MKYTSDKTGTVIHAQPIQSAQPQVTTWHPQQLQHQAQMSPFMLYPKIITPRQ